MGRVLPMVDGRRRALVATPALAERRFIVGLNQSQLAAMTGTSQAAISRIENRRQSMGMDLAQRVARALGLSVQTAIRRGLMSFDGGRKDGADVRQGAART